MGPVLILLYLLAGVGVAKLLFLAHAPNEPPIFVRLFSFLLWPVFVVLVIHALFSLRK